MSWVQTYTGLRFDLLNPTPDMVDIRDIAHALSNQCRFNGHCRAFYSVAQHSMHVSWMASASTEPVMTREETLIGLLHDATEAYVGDMVRPLKDLLPEFKAIEDRIWRVIATKYLGRAVDIPAEIKRLDNVALMTERRHLLAKPPAPWDAALEAIDVGDSVLVPLPPASACSRFLWMAQRIGVSFA